MNIKYFLYVLLILLIVFQYMKFEKWINSSKKRLLFTNNRSILTAILATTVMFFEIEIFGYLIYCF